MAGSLLVLQLKKASGELVFVFLFFLELAQHLCFSFDLKFVVGLLELYDHLRMLLLDLIEQKLIVLYFFLVLGILFGQVSLFCPPLLLLFLYLLR